MRSAERGWRVGPRLPGASNAALAPLARSVGGLRFIDGGWRQQRAAGTRVRAMGCPEADVGNLERKEDAS